MRSLLPLLLFLALAGCKHDIRNENAVRQGVLDYLASRPNLNLGSMNVQVTSVVLRKDEADAIVSFAPKGATAGGGMTIRYLLERKADRWVVKGRADSGQNPHAGAGENPHGGMTPGETGTAPPGTLPPGHPTVPPQDSGPK